MIGWNFYISLSKEIFVVLDIIFNQSYTHIAKTD
jgi:hypothetical protein